MSYQKLNQVTRPFTFHILSCNDSVQNIDTEAKYFISVYMDSEYLQVVAEEEAFNYWYYSSWTESVRVESDAYGDPKCSSNICTNDDESKN